MTAPLDGSSGRVARLIPWLIVAVFGTLTGLALHFAFGGGGSSPISLVAVEPATGLASGPVAANAGQPAPPPAPLAARAPEPSADRGATNAPPADAAPEASAAPAPSAALASPAPVQPLTGLRLRVPALNIDAQIVSLGFANDGQLDVPANGTSVGWYDISPRPGEPGNALIGAHLDWNGSLAVFGRLSELSPGDRIILNDGSARELVYEISLATAIGSDHPLSDVLATDAAGSSLTLFTCGGSFDIASSQYDERFLVRAVQIESSAPLTANR